MPRHRVAAILAADAAGFHGLLLEDEAGATGELAASRRRMGDLVGRYGGRIVAGGPGGSLLGEFPSAMDAVRCALEIQLGSAAGGRKVSARSMRFRVGVGLGRVIGEGEELRGDGVDLAVRLQDLAEPGGILISGDAFDRLEGRLALQYRLLEEPWVRDVPNAGRIYRIGIPSRRDP